jgi:hypothetical protein
MNAWTFGSLLFAFCVATAASDVWWEGESPAETNFPSKTWFSPDTFPETRNLLSGGDWLTNAGERTGDEAYAIYDVPVPADGDYDLWARKFWKHGPFRWRFGNGDWRVCDMSISLADETPLRTHLVANWVYLGNVRLAKGNARFELRLLAGVGQSLTAAFDAFFLTTEPFQPNGRLKPGEKWGLADEGYFPYEPDVDRFRDDALLDLRSLNEPVAGANGYVRQRGDRFTLGDGTSVRFWGVNLSANQAGQNRKSVDYLARKLAKLGVNAVRFHSALFDDRDGDPAKLDAERLDDLFYLVAALKRQGIYTAISFYFPLWFDIKDSYGIPGYSDAGNKKPFALLFFDERMQAIHRAWLRELFTTPNPYTGVPLARETAVLYVELQNEDSFFFWTFGTRNVPDVHWKRLENRFATWLERRYGSLEKAFETWGSATHPDDDLEAKRAGLFDAWHMTRDGSRSGGPDKTRRVGDQVRFLTELQRAFYEDAIRYLRSELNVGCLVAPSNWHVSDAETLDALERYTYSVGEVMDRHGYFGGKHEGGGASYSVREGHLYEARAAVNHPEGLPFAVIQTEGYPNILSEIGWTQPNRFRSEMPFLSAAYGALQGLDGFFFFAVGSNFLCDTAIGKFQLGSPSVIGAFPAAALAYRRGDIAEAGDAVRQVVRLEDLYAMKGSGSVSPAALDALREADIPPEGHRTGVVTTVDPLAYAVGRLMRSYGDRPEDSSVANLPRYVLRDAGIVRSLTDELAWNFRDGVVWVRSPRHQAVCGFLSAYQRFDLGDVVVECANEFGSVTVIALDDAPLRESRRVLIQAVTEDRPYGFRVEDGVIKSLGRAPFGVRNVDATVTLRFSDDAETVARSLDENGYAIAELSRSTSDTVTFRLSPNALYTVVTR